MIPTLLVLNAGSSSVKFQLFSLPDLVVLVKGQASGLGGDAWMDVRLSDGDADAETLALDPATDIEGAIAGIIDFVHGHASDWQVAAVVHRIVHGGTTFTAAVRLDETVMAALEALIPLAPLHQPHNLAAVRIAARKLGPHLQIGCFDTAFHAGHAPLFTRYAVDEDLYRQGVRRYGFHGLSYNWISEVLRANYPDLYRGRVVVAHLGNGASLCAIRNGQSIDTTMGMTAIEGLPMGTRCGALDAGAVLYMIRHLGLSVDQVEERLYTQSGLKGLSGISHDVARLLTSDTEAAAFALDYFALKTAQYAAMMAVSMGGIDGMVFTGGIGEHAATVREAIMTHLGVLGPMPVHVIAANEERMMAMQAMELLETRDA